MPPSLMARQYLLMGPPCMPEINALPPRLLFVLIKPDAIVSGKAHALLDALHAAGLPIAAWHRITQPHESQFEELYRFNLAKRALGTEPVGWWLNRQLYTLGESLALLLQTADAQTDAAALMTALKGPSHPWLCRPGQLRHTFCASNLAMNLIHSSDDATATAREARLFGEPVQWQGPLPALDSAALFAQSEALHANHRAHLDAVTPWRLAHADMHPLRVGARCALRIAADTALFSPADTQALQSLQASTDASLQNHRDARWAQLEACAEPINRMASPALADAARTLLRVRHSDWPLLQAQLATAQASAWEALVLLSTAYHRRAMFPPMPATGGQCDNAAPLAFSVAPEH